ncbi:MAG TPA: carboxypeptidase-like regulatory domain-containing protein, partial [Gemmatimonadales bacterium]
MRRWSLNSLSIAAVLWTAAIGALSHPAQAQRLSGTVWDSLITGGPLVGAQVWISGLAGDATTDKRGRFRFDSVPPGAYHLTFSHPLFDSAGVAPPVWTIDVGPQGLSGFTANVPSITSAFPGSCPPLASDAGALIGVVRDATSDSTLAGVSIQARWYVLGVAPGETLAWLPRTATSSTDARGRYVLCGVPRDGEFSLSASSGTRRTGQVTQDLSGRLLSGRSLHLGPVEMDSLTPADTTPIPRGTVVGRVQSPSGQPIAEARVEVRGTTVATQTTESGSFELTGAPLGTQVLEVAALGFLIQRPVVDVPPSAPAPVELTLALAPQVLPTIGVVARGGRASSFEQRRNHASGYLLTAEDLERQGVRRFEQLFYTVPG